MVVVNTTVASAACVIGGSSSAAAPPAPSGDTRVRQVANARTIDQKAIELGLPGAATKAALMMAFQESSVLNLASLANPDSMNYPHDGVAARAHTSVGISQQ